MLVCNISLRPVGRSVAADLAEPAAAADAPGTGNVVFATLVDDPASVNETVDAYLGEIMLEAASAADVVDCGFAFVGSISEAVTTADTCDASVPAALPTTLNPADKDTHITLSGGNLTAVGTAGWTGLVRAIKSQSAGKFYWEATFNATQTSSGIGLAIGSLSVATTTFDGTVAPGHCGVVRTGAVYVDGNSSLTIGGTAGLTINFGTIASGTVICVAVDLTAKLIWWRLGASGNWNNNATRNPATGVGGVSVPNVTTAYPTLCLGGADTLIANFGASSFVGAVPSGFTAVWS